MFVIFLHIALRYVYPSQAKVDRLCSTNNRTKSRVSSFKSLKSQQNNQAAFLKLDIHRRTHNSNNATGTVWPGSVLKRSSLMCASAVFLIHVKDMWAEGFIKAFHRNKSRKDKEHICFIRSTDIYLGFYFKDAKTLRTGGYPYCSIKTQTYTHATAASMWKNKEKVIAEVPFRDASHSKASPHSVPGPSETNQPLS